MTPRQRQAFIFYSTLIPIVMLSLFIMSTVVAQEPEVKYSREPHKAYEHAANNAIAAKGVCGTLTYTRSGEFETRGVTYQAPAITARFVLCPAPTPGPEPSVEPTPAITVAPPPTPEPVPTSAPPQFASVSVTWEVPTHRENGAPLDAYSHFDLEVFLNGELLSIITISDPRSTEYVLSGLAPGDYTFYMRTVDLYSNASALSNYAVITIE